MFQFTSLCIFHNLFQAVKHTQRKLCVLQKVTCFHLGMVLGVESQRYNNINSISFLTHSLRGNGGVIVEMGKTVLAEICVDGRGGANRYSRSDVTNSYLPPLEKVYICNKLSTHYQANKCMHTQMEIRY